MNKITLISEIIIVFFVISMILSGKNIMIGSLLLIVYLAFKYFTKKATVTAYKAALAFNSKDFDKALNLYEKAYNMISVTDNIKLRYAFATLYCGKVDTCKKILDSINYSKLSDPRAKASYKQTKGLYLWKTDNIDEAIEIYEKLNIEFESTSVYESLGYLMIVNKDYEKALEYNLKAYEYDDDSNIILDNLAESYYFTGNFEKAKELYEKMYNKEVGKKPTFSEAFYYYALILKEEGNIEDAREYLNKALDTRDSFLSQLSHDTIRKTLEDINNLQAS